MPQNNLFIYTTESGPLSPVVFMLQWVRWVHIHRPFWSEINTKLSSYQHYTESLHRMKSLWQVQTLSVWEKSYNTCSET